MGWDGMVESQQRAKTEKVVPLQWSQHGVCAWPMGCRKSQVNFRSAPCRQLQFARRKNARLHVRPVARVPYKQSRLDFLTVN